MIISYLIQVRVVGAQIFKDLQSFEGLLGLSLLTNGLSTGCCHFYRSLWEFLLMWNISEIPHRVLPVSSSCVSENLFEARRNWDSISISQSLQKGKPGLCWESQGSVWETIFYQQQWNHIKNNSYKPMMIHRALEE